MSSIAEKVSDNGMKWARDVIAVIIGNLIYAAGVVFFILPSGLITGGTTGIALIAERLWGLPISVVVGVFNVVMFLVGTAFLGRKFAMTTLVSTISYPLMLGLVEKLAGDFVLTDDLLISALFGGICIGASLALIIRLGASTGGMDIPPLILNKYFRIPVGVSLYVFDFLILVGQMFFSDRKTSLYGILLVMVYTITMDKMISLGSSKTRIEIISRDPEAIRSHIVEELDRGVTMLHAKTGYLGVETDVVYCVVDPRQLHRVEKVVAAVDPDAFIVMSKASSVHGRGFSTEKIYLD